LLKSRKFVDELLFNPPPEFNPDIALNDLIEKLRQRDLKVDEFVQLVVLLDSKKRKPIALNDTNTIQKAGLDDNDSINLNDIFLELKDIRDGIKPYDRNQVLKYREKLYRIPPKYVDKAKSPSTYLLTDLLLLPENTKDMRTMIGGDENNLKTKMDKIYKSFVFGIDDQENNKKAFQWLINFVYNKNNNSNLDTKHLQSSSKNIQYNIEAEFFNNKVSETEINTMMKFLTLINKNIDDPDLTLKYNNKKAKAFTEFLLVNMMNVYLNAFLKKSLYEEKQDLITELSVFPGQKKEFESILEEYKNSSKKKKPLSNKIVANLIKDTTNFFDNISINNLVNNDFVKLKGIVESYQKEYDKYKKNIRTI